MEPITIDPASFRDPAGFIFRKSGTIYRQINIVYEPHYTHLVTSGLYDTLTKTGKMIAHTEVKENLTGFPNHFLTLMPTEICFVTYPYEWSFEMLKDAALLTLDICITAMKFGMMLKDASAYNIQFYKGRPILLDTLSFEIYDQTRAWVAYDQFCTNFLNPLVIAEETGLPPSRLFKSFPRGTPSATTRRVLRFLSRFQLGIYLHIILKSRISKRTSHSGKAEGFSAAKTERLILHLRETIVKRRWYPGKTLWNNYYSESVSSQHYVLEKTKQLQGMLATLKIQSALDLGANDGKFSELLASSGAAVVSTDADEAVVNACYIRSRDHGVQNILPLVADLSNLSPSMGVLGKELRSFQERSSFDLVIALALVHHLYFSDRISFRHCFEMFANLTTRFCVVEFVPPDDEKVKQLAENRPIFLDEYLLSDFKEAFQKFFTLNSEQSIPGSGRILFLLEKKS